jgi:hypothetical protein
MLRASNFETINDWIIIGNSHFLTFLYKIVVFLTNATNVQVRSDVIGSALSESFEPQKAKVFGTKNRRYTSCSHLISTTSSYIVLTNRSLGQHEN